MLLRFVFCSSTKTEAYPEPGETLRAQPFTCTHMATHLIHAVTHLSVCTLTSSGTNRCCTQRCFHWQANCEANEVPVFNGEHNWQAVRGPASLGELAVDTKATNYGLVRLHWQLAILMHAVLVFSMKSVKVLSLFDRRVGAECSEDCLV